MNVAWYQYKNMHLFLKEEVKSQPSYKKVVAKTGMLCVGHIKSFIMMTQAAKH